jgi:hypothetical protein
MIFVLSSSRAGTEHRSAMIVKERSRHECQINYPDKIPASAGLVSFFVHRLSRLGGISTPDRALQKKISDCVIGRNA